MKSPVLKPKAYLKVRHKNVRAAMKELGLDALLLTHPPDVAYLTNFTGGDSILLLTNKDVHLVTDFRYQEQAAMEAAWVTAHVRDGKMADALARCVLDTGAKKVGFEANFMTFGEVHALDRAMEEAAAGGSDAKPKKSGTPAPPDGDAKPAATLSPTAGGSRRPGAAPASAGSKASGPTKAATPATLKPAGQSVELMALEDVMANQRKVKDDHEVGLIRQSIAVAEEAFNAVREEIEPGQTEGYLAGLLILELRSRGAEGTSFDPIVATGANSSLPHYRPGSEVLVLRDQPLLFDFGAKVGGYCSDLTRTFMVGQVSEKMKKVYRVVLEAQLAAIAFMRPGVTTRQADQIARDVIDKAGFGDQFGHGLGHGIGRDIHELPSLRKTGGEEELRPGMVVTVEPGIYLPGEGGVRIEDDVLITHSGCEVLTSLGKRFEDCHIE